MQAAGFTEPRPIQAQAMPAVLAGRDVLGLAQTGTGKTAAFALPILSRLAADGNPNGASPRVLILAPTRELATQIEREISALGQFTNVRSTVVYGGMPISRQVRALNKRPDIVVACPGRLLDLHQRREIDLREVEVVVLDEADHMFDMGFLPDIRRILGALPRRRQNLLFSATMPDEIRHLTNDVLRDPHVVELAHSAPAETIEHALYPCTDGSKQELLQHLISESDFSSAIVFLRTKSRAKRLAERLIRDGRRAVALQGNMNQSQRDRAMRGFRQGRYDVLVATDIAARGLDVEGVSHVVNFDVPNTPDAYTHRIGRTGRSERPGKACTFVTGQDRAAIRAIEARIGAEIPCIRLPQFGAAEAPKSRSSSSKRQVSRNGGDGARPGGAGARTQGTDQPWKSGRGTEPRRGMESGGQRASNSGAYRASGRGVAPSHAVQPTYKDSWKNGKGWGQPQGDPLASQETQRPASSHGPTVGRRARKRIRRSDTSAAASTERGAGAWGKPSHQRRGGSSSPYSSKAGGGSASPSRRRSSHSHDRTGF